MTNEFGSEQPLEHEHEEHAAVQETPAHEGEPGVWTDDQPPHDDFGAANEDMATVSQEAVTDAEVEESAPAQTKSRSMLPILAGLGGIVLLVGVIYLQFGHSSPPAPPMRLAPSAQKATPAPAAELPSQAAPPPADSAPTTSTQANASDSDISTLYKPAGTPQQVVMPPSSTPIDTTLAPIPTPPPSLGSAASTNPNSAVESSPKTAAAAPAYPPTIAPQPGNPTNPVPPLPGQVFRAVPPAANPAAANTNIASNNTLAGTPDAQQAARLSALSSRMDTLQRSLDQVTNMVAAVPGVTNHNDADMESRLNKIEQTLTKIESQQTVKTSTHNASAPKQVATAASAVTEPSMEPTPAISHSTKSSSKHKHTRTHTKSASTSSRHHATSTVSSAKSAGSHSAWVLRAATPKEAWVSSDSNSSELKHVQIGDNLPGIGVVRTIRQANGGWEIEGSTGIIR
jgi:hypothetical protein